MNLRKKLERLYAKYNRREFVDPDPLEFLYNYKNSYDREIVGLIASSLAYGRAAQILKSVDCVLGEMGRSPRAFLERHSEKEIVSKYKCFKHRFTTGSDVAHLLIGIKHAIKKHGSLEKCFMIGGIEQFVKEIGGNMLPHPSKGGARKRVNLF